MKAPKLQFFTIPKVSDVINKQLYTQVDLRSAFLQITLDEESRHLTGFNTTFGKYEFKRMPFGLKIATSVFQATMEGIFIQEIAHT
jgi:hypothetical protein